MLHITVIREIQIKTKRYHYTFITMAKIWNVANTKCWQGYGITRTLDLLVGMQTDEGTL